jgi:hypothetical protein
MSLSFILDLEVNSKSVNKSKGGSDYLDLNYGIDTSGFFGCFDKFIGRFRRVSIIKFSYPMFLL